MCQLNLPPDADLHRGVQGVGERARPGRGGELLAQPERGARGCLAGKHRVRGGVHSVLERSEVGLTVALAGVLPGAEVLVDHLRERRVELVRADLEGVAVAAGGVVGPVLRGAGGVVELPAVDVRVAVGCRHLGAEGLQPVLVRGVAHREPVVTDGVGVYAVGSQHQVGEGVVGDQRGDLTAADQLPDVLDLRLGEGPCAAVGRVREHVRGPGPAPEAAVVAVQVDAGAVPAGAGRTAHAAGAVGGVLAVHEAAVLALVRVAGGAEDRGGPAVVGLTQVDDPAVGAGELEAVHVHDRYDDHSRLLEQVGDPRVRPVVLHEVVGELHRQLTRGPFPGVVRAEEHEHRAPVLGRLDVATDLDPVDGAPVERLVRQRDPLRDPGTDRLELTHVVVVVGEGAVAVPAGRQRGGHRCCGVRRVRACCSPPPACSGRRCARRTGGPNPPAGPGRDRCAARPPRSRGRRAR